MIDVEAIADTISLPTAPDGWFDYGYTALADGRLALIRTRPDIHAEHMRWSLAVKGGDHSRPYPDVWDGDIRLSLFDGFAETDAVIIPSAEHPIVDRMADGRWLVAGSRAREGEQNAQIVTADGRIEHKMALGDGIENLLCAPDGTFWLGYFDEGVFAGQNKDRSWPVSCGGIVQFDATGTPVWSFNEQVRAKYAVADAYAMTLSGTDLWACFYTDFPIARISGGQAVFWQNRIAGAKAVAVDDDMVLLGGGYGDDNNRITLLRLTGKSARAIGSLRFGKGAPGKAHLLMGRGDIIHIVSDGTWLRVPVHKVAAALA